jgi:SprT protein
MTLSSWRSICPIQMQDEIANLIAQLQLHIKFVNPRKTKFGDFRVQFNKPLQITLNNNLGVTHGTLTFFHELAHAVCYKKFANKVKPHGKQWKAIYGKFILEVLDCQFFPPHLETAITQHAINSKSSTCYDVGLMSLLKKTTNQDESKVPITSLIMGDKFTFENRGYELGSKRRTRFLCYRLPDKRAFTFSAAALVEMME